MSQSKMLAEFITRYKEYRQNRIPLISSENISSKLIRASYGLGLSDQYCSRSPNHTHVIDNLAFGHLGPLDDINKSAINLINELFGSADCNIKPLSGLNGITVILFSLLENDDVLYRIADINGGHLSTKPIAQRLNLEVVDMHFGEDYRFDLDDFYQKYKTSKKNSKMIFLDSSYILFPYPLEEIRNIVGDDTTIVYDASHVIALTLGGLFQNPFVEGADIIHTSTHKSLWGPQKSVIAFKRIDDLNQKIHDTADYIVSNTHLHHIFALYISLLEFKHCGKKYASQLQKNALTLAESLYQYGLEVVASDQGFTESNQVWLDFGTKEKAVHYFRILEQLNISANLIFLPNNRWGWRLGLNELTRLGARRYEINTLARIISDMVYNRKELRILQAENEDLRKGLSDIAYSLDSVEGYKDLLELMCWEEC